MSTDYDRIRQDNIREYGQGTRHLDFLQRLYADRTHFIFELLQNAEDAHATQVTFVLDRQQLLVHHDGRPFNDDDVRGICGVSVSPKDAELTAIGKFGIGFKSVYAYSTLPEVHSGEEHFRIRHYVRPEATHWAGEPLNGRTNFVFPFDRDDVAPDQAYDEIAAGLRDLDPVTLLFLRHIQSVTLESPTGRAELTRTRDQADASGVELVRRIDGRVVAHQYWWTFHRPLDHLGHVRRRVEIAFKRTGADRTAPVERLRTSPLVAYFPTDKETRLGFLLQAPLRTTPARDNVPEHDPDNIALIDEATHLLVDTLERLRDTGRLGLDVLDALPIHPDAFPEGAMLRRLFDGVRDALRNRPLLPTADTTTFVSAAQLKLARGADMRELLTPAQLGELAGAPGAVYWQPAQLTAARPLWDYLRQEVGVEEVTPDWIVTRLDTAVFQDAEDAWLIRLYTFLANSPALWRAPRGAHDRPGPARTLPLIRLEDGNHVPPFGADGRPNAYLPGPTPSDYPTVRRTIAADADARSFLIDLGLQEPDAVDEVLEKVLPRYEADPMIVADDQHDRDLTLISRALQVATRQRRTTLVTRLRSTAFLLARTADHSAAGYRTPTETYWPDDELENYFLPWPQAWFLDARYQIHRRTLTELGVADQVRIQARATDPSGHVVLLNTWGDHSRGLNGFDPALRIAGLEAALANPDRRRSLFIWNLLLAPRADRLRGTVESAGRAEYINATRRDQNSEPHRLATSTAWLPTPDGRWAKPGELGLDDLPQEFLRHQGLADSLGMITPIIQQASTQLGIPVDLLRYLADNPDTVADLTRKADRARHGAAIPAAADQPPAPLDYATNLQEAFTKPGMDEQPSDDDGRLPYPGQVAVPGMRRERTAAEVADAQAAEPPVSDRFRFLPRKVWDGKDPATRQFLLEQYAGHCQICDATFPKRDGDPYFDVVYLVSHTNAAWIDRPGNVLCLCPTCAAKFIHGQIEATDILDQVRSWRTRSEGGDHSALHLTLASEPRIIRYTEKHLIDLQTLLTPQPAQSQEVASDSRDADHELGGSAADLAADIEPSIGQQ